MLSDPTKVTIDTNVIISALVFGGNSRVIIEKLIKRQIIAFTSTSLVSELIDKLIMKFDFSTEMIFKLEALIASSFQIVYPKKRVDISRDEDDNRVLEVAIASKSKFIITGDRDLLTLKRHKGIVIISPKEFIEYDKI